MQYVLGNMLNGAGGLNADGLSLDLQFAADKTLTARKGPTPVFTRGSTGTFVGSNGLIQSAAINAARFDHDPVTLASRGLLIEESRTNLILQSQTFQTTWTTAALNTTGTPAYINVATAPDGTTTAEKLIATITTSTHQFRQSVTLVSGTTYTVSNYFKAAEQKFASFQLFGVANGSNDWLAYFDISTATPTAGAFNGFTSISITDAGNGWVRCTGTFTATASGTLEVRIGGSGSLSAGGQFYTGDALSGILVWGAQLEAGSFATSYIPTTTGSVVRSADVCSITGGDFTSFYNQSEGAMLTNAFTPASGDRTVLSADDNTANEMIRLRTEGTNPFFKVTDGGSELVAIDAGTVSANTSFKLIGAYKLNDFASSINGGAAVTDTSGTIPTVDRMRIGAGQGGNTMCGCVTALRYYKKRLPNAKLQALTA
jgi:hypothetical protein